MDYDEFDIDERFALILDRLRKLEEHVAGLEDDINHLKLEANDDGSRSTFI